jgi:RNA polymerase sigma-70 factor (ECF subfamily)
MRIRLLDRRHTPQRIARWLTAALLLLVLGAAAVCLGHGHGPEPRDQARGCARCKAITVLAGADRLVDLPVTEPPRECEHRPAVAAAAIRPDPHDDLSVPRGPPRTGWTTRLRMGGARDRAGSTHSGRDFDMHASDDHSQRPAVALHVPSMRRVARRILGRDDLADDAVQEALITVHGIREAPRNFEAWLLRTVIHRSLAVRRAELRRSRHELAAAEAFAGVARFPDPEAALHRKELAGRIGSALQALPIDQRRAFVLREIHGLEYGSISSRLGVPVGTVRSRLHRARRTLRDFMRRGAMPPAKRIGVA